MPWDYSGDVSIEYGGMFLETSEVRYHYADCVEVTDLGSACGFDGAILVERYTVTLPTRRTASGRYAVDRYKVRQVLESCGPGVSAWLAIGKQYRRMVLFEACAWYGYRDPADRSETYQLEADLPLVFDGWEAERLNLAGQDLREWIEQEFCYS